MSDIRAVRDLKNISLDEIFDFSEEITDNCGNAVKGELLKIGLVSLAIGGVIGFLASWSLNKGGNQQ